MLLDRSQDTDEQRTRVRFLTDKTNFMRESIDYLEKKTENQERIILKQQEKIEDLTVGRGCTYSGAFQYVLIEITQG
jgi:hypothetical protein